MFRPHLRHPQEAPLQDLKLTAIRQMTAAIHFYGGIVAAM
jgi:hypothetical protein